MRRNVSFSLRAIICVILSAFISAANASERPIPEITQKLIQWYDHHKVEKPAYFSSQEEGEAFITWLSAWQPTVIDSLDARLEKKSGFSGVCKNVFSETEDRLYRRFKVYAINKKKYKINISYNDDPKLTPVVKKIDAFFYEIYPMIQERYGKRGAEPALEVSVRFDPELTNVPAYASNGSLTFSNDWFLKNPNDIGVLTHESIHLLQKDYQRGVPGWLVEGMADYIRHIYKKVAHEAFPLPADTKTRNYKDAYRVTARFLNWLETQSPGFNDYLHHTMMNQRYNESMFSDRFGMKLDELWALYAEEK